jgi:hypothetical protein
LDRNLLGIIAEDNAVGQCGDAARTAAQGLLPH